jgi:nitrile hydratase
MERIEPSYYLTSSYYERWLEGSITLMVEKGVVTQAEFDARLADLRGGTS